MQLFSEREIQAMITLLNRTPMTAAEQLYAQSFFQRLAAFCTPPDPMADATAMADALDEEEMDSDDREIDRHG